MNTSSSASRFSLVRSSGVLGFTVFFSLVIASCGGGGGGSSSSSSPSGGGSTPTTPTTPTPPTTAVLFFGAQTHFGQGWSSAIASRVAAANVRDVRDELFWEIVEPTPGNYVFPASYDAYMNALRDQGITPLIALDFENHNYDGGQTPYTDAAIAAYARYAVAVLKHYGTQIKAVEIWNEYNGSFAKGPATADRAGTYFKMLRAAYQAIKAERPDVTVVGGATAGVPLPYFDKLFAAGALNYLDAVSIHPYRYDSTPEGVEVQVAALQDLMAQRGGAKPIWVTEIGWGTHGPAAPGDLNIDETTQARFLVRAFGLLTSAGVRQMYWYQFRDESGEGNMGLVRSDGTTAKRSFDAMATLNTKLRNATFVAREQTASGVYSLRFSAGNEVRLLWALTPITVPVPSGTSVTDLFGATVSSGGNSITVADSPVYVSGPLPGLAGASTSRSASAITDSAAAFSTQQGNYGWYYGYFVGPGTSFQPLTTTRTTDWKEDWVSSNFPSLFVAETDQHPGFSGGQPISAVRRWTSTVTGNVRITARFKVGIQGDGVRVRVLADGQTIYSATLSTTTSISGDFTADRAVQAGTNLDFAVDPGSAGNLNFDATLVAVTIERAN